MQRITHTASARPKQAKKLPPSGCKIILVPGRDSYLSRVLARLERERQAALRHGDIKNARRIVKDAAYARETLGVVWTRSAPR